jgi:hypothetical protein
MLPHDASTGGEKKSYGLHCVMPKLSLTDEMLSQE